MKVLRQETENIERVETSVNGLRLNAFVSKGADYAGKPTIILVQGLGISASYMIPTMSEMAKYARVFALDFPGFGDSEKPWHIFNITELADVLADWMNVAGIGRAVLVGHSLGSQIAAEFVRRNSCCGIPKNPNASCSPRRLSTGTRAVFSGSSDACFWIRETSRFR